MIITKKSLTILIIEDNPGEYLILKEYLKKIELTVKKIVHSVNMESVPSLIENINFDLVFLDLTLPDSTGIDSVIKINQLSPKTAIICLSGYSGDVAAIKSIIPGAQDYLAKDDFDEKLLSKSIQYSLERKRLEKELAEQYLNQQKLVTETTILAQEKERNEIGKELHDNINQILATVKLYHSMMRTDKTNGAALLAKSTEYVNEAIEEIRKLSKSLVSPSLGDMTLSQALSDLADEVNKTNTCQVALNYYIEKEEMIGSSRELMIYRVVQEQINNILKHSNAENATINLTKKGKNLVLTISDDGIGFDTHQRSTGIGIQNIRSRVEFYSGKLDIISRPGAGCQFKIIVPC